MQNKSAIWVFTVLLIAACVYQLGFTPVTRMAEGQAETYALTKLDSVRADWKGGYLNEDSVLSHFADRYLSGPEGLGVYPIFGHDYDYCKKREINLGLDLQGGMNVTLEVSVVDLITVLASQNGETDEFQSVIRKAKEKQLSDTRNFVALFGEAYEELYPGTKLAAIFSNFENKDKFSRDDSNDQILAKIQLEADDAVKRTEQVLRRRIDNLGVVQPKIQRLAASGRIIVELPGVKDQARVRKILQNTAKLEFWETYSSAELIPYLNQVNDYLADRIKATENVKEEVAATPDSNQVAVADPEAPAPDSTVVDSTEEELTGLEKLLAGDPSDSTVNDSAANLALGLEEQRARFPWYSIMGPPVNQLQDGRQIPIKGAVAGVISTNDTAQLNAYLKLPGVQKIFPRDLRFRWSAKAEDGTNGGKFVTLYAIKLPNSEGKAKLEGDAVTNARVASDPLGQPEVALTMSSAGAEIWKVMTGNNVDKAIAIVLDDLVYSAPNVSGEISGGQSSISGGFSQQEASDLAAVLKAGKLPAPAKIIEEAIVGPTLGKEAVSAGLTSFMVALLLVLIYMFFYYSGAGGVADIALLANLFFVLGVLTSLGATLTLPGIAGIVLTIGMSVDANVLIYERIREELNAGKGLRLAIADGYNNAYSSIIDANLTTLITGAFLLLFGTGPIQGFATTLIIGIITSLFSAIFITRLIFEWRLEKKADISFATKLTENAFKSLAIQFVTKRKMYYVVSGLIILIGIGSLATKQLDFGVDFIGGRSYVVRFDETVNVTDVAGTLEQKFVDENNKTYRPEVKTFGGSNQVKITTKFMIQDQENNTDSIVEALLVQGLQDYNPNSEIMSSVKVEPTIADDVRTSAFWAVFFSLLGIFLYIWFRFRRWQFGLGALVALFHDVLVLLGLFSLLYGILPFSLEVDQAFIAAILTVVGYSINDTVVVFDRIREFLGLYKRKEYMGVVNDALNSTLSRTINTSLSTFIVLLIIFIFGGEVIRGFVFALMIGVAVGTYSSLCVATPVMLDLARRGEDKETKK